MEKTVLVKDYMTPSPHSIGVSVSLAEARQMMRTWGVRHLPVLERGALVGLVSERDVQMVEATTDDDLKSLSVEEAMSPTVYSVRPSAPLREAADYLSRHRLGSAVVTRGEKVVGVLTLTDGMRALADALR
jgi:acetoin utilization protein AcuB